MSNFLAIAAVTAALRNLLLPSVQTDVPGAEVTTGRPDAQGAGIPALGVNVFLYRTQPNGGMRNIDLPTRRNDGAVMNRPQAAVDLDYLFSFYGSHAALEPQRLMGSTLRTLHAVPQLTEGLITATLSDASFAFLSESDLAEQIDRIKVTPLDLSLDDLGKLWSVFFQTPYVLSVAFRAGVVLLESRATPKPRLPVRDYGLYAFTLTRPVVERIVSRDGDDQPILAGSSVIVHGRNLRAESSEVVVAGVAVVPTVISASRIEIVLPDGLTAGPQGLQIFCGIMAGEPPVPHRSAASDLAIFVVNPGIGRNNGGHDITVTNVQGTGGSPRSAEILVGMDPDVAENQRVTLELLTSTGDVRSFFAAERAATTDRMTFAVSGLQAGEYLLRVRVDGAATPFDLDEEQQTTGPKVTLP